MEKKATKCFTIFANIKISCPTVLQRRVFQKHFSKAASSELPIVASNVPGCKEICIHKYNGLLVPPKNSILLAKAIEKILSNPSAKNTEKMEENLY